MCLRRHQVHKWTLSRLGREVPSKFLLQHLWMPAERLQKRPMCLLEIAFLFAAVEAEQKAGCIIHLAWEGTAPLAASGGHGAGCS